MPAPVLVRLGLAIALEMVRSLARVASRATLMLPVVRVRLPPEIREVSWALFAFAVMSPLGVRILPADMFTCPPLSVSVPKLVDDPTLRTPSELMVTAEVGESWLAKLVGSIL